MSDLLAIGASGVRAYQTALGTVSENIANAGNAAFARRSTTLSEIGAADRGMASSAVQNGNGVAVTGIARAGDQFKAASVRSAGADLAKTEAGSVWLDRIQTSLTGNQLGDRLTTFFNAAKTLAADPTSTAARATMLEQGNAVAAGFTATGAALAQSASDLDATAEQATAQLGALTASLAKVNDGLGRVAVGTAAAASLGDQRDQILDQMSALVDVTVTTDAIGRATVRAGGSTGPTLVAPATEPAQVTYVRNDEGAVSFAVHREGATASLVPNGGALSGIADGAQRIAAARTTLNGLASAFVDGVNAAQASGQDLNGTTPGAAMFASDTANPTAMTMTLTDPAGIAAATPGGGTRDNGNLANFDTLRTTGKFEATLTATVATNAATIASRKTVAEAQSAIRDGAVTARDAVTGVDLDSEAVDLLRFQQAYQASSRVIQAAKDIFQSILEIR